MENKSKEEVAREVEQTRAEAKRAVKDAAEIWSGRNAVASAWRATKRKYYKAQDKVTDTAYATDETIRGHVYSTLGIALGVGVVLGYFMTAKPRRAQNRKKC